MNQTTHSLVEGEKIALEIIEEAKKLKGQMNESATLEARQQLDEEKQKLQREFEEIKKTKQAQTDDLQQYEDQAQKEIKEIRAQYAAHKDEVKDMLLDKIMDVNYELPKVVIGNFEKQLDE